MPLDLDSLPRDSDRIDDKYYTNFFVQLVNAGYQPPYPKSLIGNLEGEESNARTKAAEQKFAKECLRRLQAQDKTKQFAKNGMGFAEMLDLMNDVYEQMAAADASPDTAKGMMRQAIALRDMYVDSVVHKYGDRQDVITWNQRVFEACAESLYDEDTLTAAVSLLYFMETRDKRLDKTPILNREQEDFIIIGLGELFHQKLAQEMVAAKKCTPETAGFKDIVKKEGKRRLEEICDELGYRRDIISFARAQ